MGKISKCCGANTTRLANSQHGVYWDMCNNCKLATELVKPKPKPKPKPKVEVINDGAAIMTRDEMAAHIRNVRNDFSLFVASLMIVVQYRSPIDGVPMDKYQAMKVVREKKSYLKDYISEKLKSFYKATMTEKQCDSCDNRGFIFYGYLPCKSGQLTGPCPDCDNQIKLTK